MSKKNTPNSKSQNAQNLDRALKSLLRKSGGYLFENGWSKSFHQKSSIDRNESPIPWFTYPSIAFLEPRILPNMNVFEYGSGNSTLWWAKRVASVIACEHHQQWYNQISAAAPANATILLRELGPEKLYAKEISKYSKAYDVIVIDGRDRITCTENCIGALKDNGIVIFDNSDAEHYKPALQFLINQGFKCIDFVGMGPITVKHRSTSIFYKSNNCLDI